MPGPIPTFDYTSIQPPQPSFRSNSIFINPSSIQSDRRFSYFPPDFTQPQVLPNAWDPRTVAPPHQHPPASTDQASGDPASFVQPTSYSFVPHLFADQNYDMGDRQGSLSQHQQLELMQSLETEGLSEIDNFMNLSAQYENSIKQ
jgi:hypothetical protein